MHVTILTNLDHEGLFAVKEAVAIANLLQPDFQFRIEPVGDLPNGRRIIDPDRLARTIKKRQGTKRTIAVIGAALKGDYFDYSARRVNIVSTARWEKKYAPPPLKVYLIFQFAYAISAFVADLPYRQMQTRMVHKGFRACVFDSTIGRRKFLSVLIAAYLCADCEARLSEWGVTDKQLDSIARLLSYVREFAIHRPRTMPTSVFIGHGRRKDWESVRDHLRDQLGLDVDEFNVSATAGFTTVERLAHMLAGARFAILVMTAEDRQLDGRVNARQNVVHEIGLFQGKLGFHNSIIVKEAGVEEFSNIRGLTYISFPRGKITRAFSEIERVLLRERVVGQDSILNGSATTKRRLRKS